MSNYFIIHGTYGDPSDNWFPWLKQEIELMGFKCTVPKFETKDGINNYEIRKKQLKEYLKTNEINEDTIFICHSSGPIIISKFLLEEQIEAKGLVSVSGFNNAYGPYEDYNKINKDFFISDDKLKTIHNYFKHIHCFYSDNDPYLKYEDLEKFANNSKAVKHFIKDGGHLNAETGYTRFPELIEVINEIEK